MNRLIATLAVLASIAIASACGRDRVSTVFPVSPVAPTQTPDPRALIAPPANPPDPPARIEGLPIVLGVPVSSAVEKNEPACLTRWELNWGGICRQYDLVAPADGTLSARLKWPGPQSPMLDPDVLIVEPGDGSQ